MNCLLIFDHLNDIVYTKYNKQFVDHINEFATVQGLISGIEPGGYTQIQNNVIVQIFSPIITSQRIMNCQFGNSYTSIQCEDNINMCFDEYMGYLFLSISRETISTIKLFLNISITFIRYLCGPDVYQLKLNEELSKLTTNLLDNWIFLNRNDQAIFVEAIEQLMINSELSSFTIQILHRSVDKLVTLVDFSKIHAIIFVQNKLLSLYSSQNAKELSPSDIFLLTILSQSTSFTNSEINSYQLLLNGPGQTPKCLPHIVHIIQICEGIHLLYLIEVGNSALSSSLYETFCYLHTMQTVQIQRDIEILRPAFENLDASVKRLNDALRKIKYSIVESCTKQLMKKWEVIKKKYSEFIRNRSDEALLRAETLALGFLENLKQLLSLTSIDQTIIHSTKEQAIHAGKIVLDNLNSYNEFLTVKAIRNFTLGSDSLTINKYLEEFPGLVHFLYVDRSNHRVITPTLDFNSDETNKLTKKKIWHMINFSKNHLQEGNLSLMWKDTIFNYAYFLWFEDNGGSSLKPIVHPTNSSKVLPVPGLISEDFYYKLKEVCFPKTSPTKIRCYELFCIHLGLVTASCVLEHTRRLAATIWELKGHPAHPIDLL